MELNRGIYLLRPKGAIYQAYSSNLEKKTANTINVNYRHVKFGKTEISFQKRKKDYIKIFGDNFIFEPILMINDFKTIKFVEKKIREIFYYDLVKNPKTNKKLEWLKDFTLDHVKKIILKNVKVRYKKLSVI